MYKESENIDTIDDLSVAKKFLNNKKKNFVVNLNTFELFFTYK